MAAAAKYASDDTGEQDRPMRVCAEAGRKCVRNIHQFPVLSPEWIQLVDSLKQLTRLVQLEGRMPANEKVAETHGRDKQSEGTLWDQEAHENAIRILVEEAKVNLCLRMMNDYKKWHYSPESRRETMQQAIVACDLNEAQLDQKCRQFEEAMGVLLWRAFVHVETLQLMDIPLLIEHTAMVLEFCEGHRQEQLGCSAKEQEMVAMYYFAALMRHAEELNNSELLAKTREFRLIHLATLHIHRHANAEYPEDYSHDIAQGLAAICDNEDFQTNWPEFFLDPEGIQNREQMMQFLQLREVFVDPIIAQYPEKQKVLRPLTDFFRTIERSLR